MADKIIFGESLGGFTDRRKNVGIPVTPVRGPNGFSAYIYQCWLNVDYDGAHRAYGLDRDDVGKRTFPHQKNLDPLESRAHHGSLMNARFETTGHWVGLFSATEHEARRILSANYPGWQTMDTAKQDEVLDQFLDTRAHTKFGTLEDRPGNKKFPVVQLPELKQPQKGYYVSISNAHTDENNHNLWDQNRYLDAGEVAYTVVPRLPRARKGDFGLVIRNRTGDHCAFLLGDSANKHGSTRLGECSAYIYMTLGEGKYNDENYSFILFPGSGNGAADNDAVGRMDGVVKNQLAKLTGGDDVLARRLAPKSPQYDRLKYAIWEAGGRQASYPPSVMEPEPCDQVVPF